MKFNEDVVEQATLSWFEELGYARLHGPDIADDGPTPERASTRTSCSKAASAEP